MLAHELAHVLQQRRGPVAGTGDKVRISDPADRFEREAQATAQRALRTIPGQRRVAEPRGSSAGPGISAQSALTVQRLLVKYGGINGNDVGTSMLAEIDPGNPQVGSKPSVVPNWWPGCTTAPGQAWMSKFMVQGHLLNEQVGGPGNTMDNLTPLTKSANSQHHSKVERQLKQLAKTNLVRYHVEGDYSRHPTGAALTGDPNATALNKDLNANVAPKLAYKLDADYTAFDYNTGKQVAQDSWDIWNEAR